MESKVAVTALTALGHEGRLAVFRLLARRAPEGVRPSEIAEALGMKRNTLSVHVSTLERAGLVTSRREGKSVFYGIDLAATGALVGYLAADCCRGRPEVCAPAALPFLNPTGVEPMSDRVWNVLFICTGNSARSIFAEAIMTKLGRGRFRAFSAGTRPFSEINPKTLHVLKVHGHDVSDLRSKNIGEFAAADAPHMDFVFTVCDGAANEECPPLPGQPVSGHWGVPDPVVAETEPGNANLAFQRAYGMLERRISIFLSTPLERLERTAIQQHVDEIAALPETDDAQEGAA